MPSSAWRQAWEEKVSEVWGAVKEGGSSSVQGMWEGSAAGRQAVRRAGVVCVSYGFTLLRLSAEPAHSTEALKGSSRQGSGPQLGHAP